LKKLTVYKAPLPFVWIFYGFLLVWTVVSIVFLGPRAAAGQWPTGQLLMIAFVLGYTWYFSLGIFYKVVADIDGTVEMTSIRRKASLQATQISLVEGPRFALLPFAFIKFRLDREKAYVFCNLMSQDLGEILALMKRANKEMQFKSLPSA
jgi:hypothetical protein